MNKRNFKRNLVMMMAVVLLSAIFCSCNAAGGAAGDETVSSVSNSNGNSIELGMGSVNVILPEEISVAVTADNKAVTDGQFITVEAGKSLALEMVASLANAKYMWYVGAEKTSEEASFTFETSHPGVYTVMAAAANGSADSVNFNIIVK